MALDASSWAAHTPLYINVSVTYTCSESLGKYSLPVQEESTVLSSLMIANQVGKM